MANKNNKEKNQTKSNEPADLWAATEANSQCVNELLEEGNAFEAEVVKGVYTITGDSPIERFFQTVERLTDLRRQDEADPYVQQRSKSWNNTGSPTLDVEKETPVTGCRTGT